VLDQPQGQLVLRRERGTSLIELMIGLAILGVLLGMGIPAFQTMMQNYQIRTTAEAMISGLQTARNEAVRRNTTVRFQLVNSLDSDCNPVETGTSWVISRNDPTAKCDKPTVTSFLEPNNTGEPQIVQKYQAEGGTATVSGTSGGAAASAVVFTSLGRIATGSGSIDTIDIANPTGGTCEHDATPGKMRCMRIRVSGAGQVKMCDPKVTDTADSRYCQ
jgi:type IV fimbrial biogenesis protein FimT